MTETYTKSITIPRAMPSMMVQTLRYKTPIENEVRMLNTFKSAPVILLALLVGRPVFAGMVSFDFDEIQSPSKKGAAAPAIELYMEGLFGSDLSVSQNAAFGRRAGSAVGTLLQSPSTALGISNGYLKAGKGKGSGISFDFGGNPIHSFSIDWLLAKGGKSFAILADGVVINQQTLSKAQKKSGASGHQNSYFFDTPIHKLEFVGLKKKSFAIDNLVINIPLPTDEEAEENEALNEQNESNNNQNAGQKDNYGPGGNNTSETNLLLGALDNPPSRNDIIHAAAAVPEPSSWLMLALGLCGAWASRKLASPRSA
jgi:PEP-CTERM motif-containing protein